jgi:hypothetical protein
VGYQGQVLPMLVAAYILATIEKWLRKVVPTVLDNFLLLLENHRHSLNLDVLKSYRVQPLKTDCPQTF